MLFFFSCRVNTSKRRFALETSPTSVKAEEAESPGMDPLAIIDDNKEGILVDDIQNIEALYFEQSSGSTSFYFTRPLIAAEENDISINLEGFTTLGLSDLIIGSRIITTLGGYITCNLPT